MTSEISKRAQALVAGRLPHARGLGRSLVDVIDDPDTFVERLRDGLTKLADDAYAAEQARVAPGSGPVLGVRNPLLDAVTEALRPALQESSPSSALWLAERLAGEPEREFTLVAHAALRRSLRGDPERTWQLMRRFARVATEWISVDSLAELYAHGILGEPFRWAELEQLIYSADRWERRLVGSTIARLPYELPRERRTELSATPGLTLIKSLIGDAQPDVQESLSWALRSWLEVDGEGVRDFLSGQADLAHEAEDGYRAWVVRDALTAPSVEPAWAEAIRARLEGIRRRAGAPSTSAAAAIAGAFVGYEELTNSALRQQGARQGFSTHG